VKDDLQKMVVGRRRMFKRWEKGEGETSKDERKVKEIFQRWEKGEGDTSKDGSKVKEILQKFSKERRTLQTCTYVQI
jgi:hypothetical protein